MVDAEGVDPYMLDLIRIVVTALYLIEKVEQVRLDTACAAIEEN